MRSAKAVAGLGRQPQAKQGADWVGILGSNPAVTGKQGYKSRVTLLLYIVLTYTSGVSQSGVQSLNSVWDREEGLCICKPLNKSYLKPCPCCLQQVLNAGN